MSSKRYDGQNYVDTSSQKRYDGTNWVDVGTSYAIAFEFVETVSNGIILPKPYINDTSKNVMEGL